MLLQETMKTGGKACGSSRMSGSEFDTAGHLELGKKTGRTFPKEVVLEDI